MDELRCARDIRVNDVANLFEGRVGSNITVRFDPDDPSKLQIEALEVRRGNGSGGARATR